MFVYKFYCLHQNIGIFCNKGQWQKHELVEEVLLDMIKVSLIKGNVACFDTETVLILCVFIYIIMISILSIHNFYIVISSLCLTCES